MTTVLFWFYMRALSLATLLVLLIIATMGVALAQDAAPAVAPTGWEASIALVRDSFIAALIAVVSGAIAWLSRKADAWLGGRIDLNATMDALQWEQYLREAASNAFAHAQARLGLSPDKIATIEEKTNFLAAAFRFIAKHNDDIVKFADKDGNGVIDILETQLAKIAPNLPRGAEPAAAPAMGFMDAEPVRRAPRPAREMAERLRPTPPAEPVKPAPKRAGSKFMLS